MRTVTTRAPLGRRRAAFRGKVVAVGRRGVASRAMEARSTPVAVRVQRPAADVEAFLAADRRLFGRKTIALPGAPSKPVGAILRFEIVLADGVPVVRGEGRVVTSGPLDGDGEHGLLLALTKLDPPSKALFDRIAQERANEGEPRAAEPTSGSGERGEPEDVSENDPPPEGGDAPTLPPDEALAEDAPAVLGLGSGTSPGRDEPGLGSEASPGREAVLARLRSRKPSN